MVCGNRKESGHLIMRKKEAWEDTKEGINGKAGDRSTENTAGK